MDCYIIRIYRRDENDSRNVVGLVEIVGIEEQRPFKGTEELISILSETNKGTRKRKARAAIIDVRATSEEER